MVSKLHVQTSPCRVGFGGCDGGFDERHALDPVVYVREVVAFGAGIVSGDLIGDGIGDAQVNVGERFDERFRVAKRQSCVG